MKYWKLSKDKKDLILKRIVMIEGDVPTELSYQISKNILKGIEDDLKFGDIEKQEFEEAKEILNKLVSKA